MPKEGFGPPDATPCSVVPAVEFDARVVANDAQPLCAEEDLAPCELVGVCGARGSVPFRAAVDLRGWVAEVGGVSGNVTFVSRLAALVSKQEGSHVHLVLCFPCGDPNDRQVQVAIVLALLAFASDGRSAARDEREGLADPAVLSKLPQLLPHLLLRRI